MLDTSMDGGTVESNKIDLIEYRENLRVLKGPGHEIDFKKLIKINRSICPKQGLGRFLNVLEALM